MRMIHHLSFPVSDLLISAAFYDLVLSSLGYRRVCVAKNFIGYGTEDGKDNFALVLKDTDVKIPGPGFHLAFSATDKASVAAFHAAALMNGGKDNGAPGLRPQYGPNYYAAFVFDPDGYKLEAVVVE